jgi:hypothetical protein
MNFLILVIIVPLAFYLVWQWRSRQLDPQQQAERRLRALKPLNHVPLDDGFWSSVERDLREARAKDRERRMRQ